MNSNTQYIPLSDEEKANNVTTPVELTQAELLIVKKASRWVIFLCFVQLLLALLGLVCGGILLMGVSAIFISIGIVGAAKQRVRLLTVHFVYSLVLYILSLIGVVLLILYCDGCRWWIYVAGFFIILIQAVGMRHSRILICLLKKKNGTQCGFMAKKACSNSAINNAGATAPQEIELTTQPTPSNNQVPMFIPMPLPAHQVNGMNNMNNLNGIRVPYFPVQSVQYPIMQHPTIIFPNNMNNNAQPQFTLNPVVYKQI